MVYDGCGAFVVVGSTHPSNGNGDAAVFDDMTLNRFWGKVGKGQNDDCWLWLSGLSRNGYGIFRSGARNVRAHRFSYEAHSGPIPQGLVIDHMCRNRACVNPAHLRAVTPKVNALENSESFAANNAKKTHCPKGHELTPDNVYLHPLRGWRLCRTCKQSYHKSSMPSVCKYGHDAGGGKGVCKVCKEESNRRWREKNVGYIPPNRRRAKEALDND